MTAERTQLQENVLAGLIEQGMPVVALSPHLDDAVLSCGALLTYAVSRTCVTVVTFFTEPGQAPYPTSARRYLHQAGEGDADAVYSSLRAQDRAALEPLGITCVHAGLTDALFRRHARPGRSRPARLLPELGRSYLSRRSHVTSRRIGSADAGTLRETREIIQRVAGSGASLVLAPLAVGGDVDHVLVRTAAQSSGAPVGYYHDFPGRRDSAAEAFIYRHDLVETRWPEPDEPIQASGYHALKLSRGAGTAFAAEVFYSAANPSATASSAWWR
ncbi:MAG TPA: PIG-L family deacetylase [Streptosporangiaceae bacterium]|nr:PIG-L family deacetylase [Streptosporangiaceae bacterium]